MKCPIVFSSNLTGTGEQRFVFGDCLKQECEWWNEHFGMCSQAVDAYLKGQEDRRREKEIIRKGG